MTDRQCSECREWVPAVECERGVCEQCRADRRTAQYIKTWGQALDRLGDGATKAVKRDLRWFDRQTESD